MRQGQCGDDDGFPTGPAGECRAAPRERREEVWGRHLAASTSVCLVLSHALLVQSNF